MSKSIIGLIVLWCMSLPLKAEQPIFTISSADANPGAIIDINIHVDNFTDIVSTQFSINWDPAVLEFKSGKNFNASIPGFTSNSLGVEEIAQGKLRLQWFEASITPVTIADGSLYFTIEFEVVGDPCQSSAVSITGDPLEIEVGEGEEGVDVGLVTNNGLVTIPGTGCSENILLTGDNVVGPCGENVCVEFTVQNFESVGVMDFSLVFNSSVLQFTEIRNLAPLLGFTTGGSTNLVAPDSLRIVWFNSNVENESLPDGTVLFELCFNVIGTGGQSSEITFGANEVIFSDVDDNAHVVTITPAVITAECALEGFALIAEDICAQPGETVCMDIKVNDFDDIVAMQFSMNWDSTRFRFDRIEGLNLTGLELDNFGTPTAIDIDEGELVLSWIDLSLSGVTVPDFTAIFRLCLRAVGPIGSSTAINFTGTPNDIEILNAADSILDYTLVQAQAQIRQSCDPVECEVSYTLFTSDPACPGNCNGAMSLTVTTVGNCPTNPTFLWSTGATSEDISGLCAGPYCVTITVGSTIIIACDTLFNPAPIEVASQITDPNPIGASNGSIDITVSGGAPPYTFNWSTPPGGNTEDLIGILPVGTYTVTITDNNGCTFVPNAFVVGAELSAAVTNVSCNGGSNGAINISVSFGTGPYTYLWNTVPPQSSEDITNLIAGTYCVTVTDNTGSTRDSCFTVTQPAALVVTATITHDVNENCQGAIDLNVTGGILPYSYSWGTQDMLNLCGGEYCVTITYGQGCTVDTCFTVFSGNLNVSLSATQYGGFQTSCNASCDGAVTTTVTGGTGTITYAWSNGPSTQNLSNLCDGTYTVTVTDGDGKTATATIVINSPDPITIAITTTLPSDIGTSDGAVSAVANGGVPGYTYQWTGPVNGNTAALNNIPSGTYTLEVTDANGCQETELVQLLVDGIPCYAANRVITPNEDGRNDFFIITCTLDAPNRLYIFNRHGGLVYEAVNYQNNWDGVNEDDEEVPDGGYLWVLEVSFPGGVKQIHKGAVNVLRTAD